MLFDIENKDLNLDHVDIINEDIDNYFITESSNINFQFYNTINQINMEFFDGCLFNESIDINNIKRNLINNISDILSNIITLIENLFLKLCNNIKELYISFKQHSETIVFGKDDIENIVEYKGYKFTLDINLKLDRVSILGSFDLQKDFSKIKQGLFESNLNEHNYSLFRGQLIGKNYAVSKDDFKDELFKTFRNNKSQPSDQIYDTYNLFDHLKAYKEIIKKLRDEKNEIIDFYKETIDSYRRLITKVSDGDDTYIISSFDFRSVNDKTRRTTKEVLTKEEVENIRRYCIMRTREAKEICTIVNQAYSEKIRASIDQYKQSLKIIKYAKK